MAADQKRAPISLGFIPPNPNTGTSNLQLNALATWLAFGFRLDQAKTLAKVQVYCLAVTGSLGVNDLVCDVFSSSGGVPNASLQSVDTVTSTPVTGTPSWVEFTPFTQSLLAATQYWIVLRNNGAPSNYPQYQWGGAGTVPTIANGSSAHVGWSKVHSTTSGSPWTTSPQGGVCSVRLQFSDGTYDGFPVQGIGGGTDRANGTSEVGVQFTVPSGPQLNVRGLSFYTNISGTPTGNLVYKLYTGSTPSLIASTQGVGNTNVAISGGAYYPDYFASPVALTPGQIVTCTISSSASETGSNGFVMGEEYKFASDPNTLALLPFSGTFKKVTYDGTTWTPATTSIFPFALLLDSAGEFTTSAGGGYVPQTTLLGG